MDALLMVITVPSGFMVAYSSAPAPGITAAGMAVADTDTVAAATDTAIAALMDTAADTAAAYTPVTVRAAFMAALEHRVTLAEHGPAAEPR
jgi:hypothetical protein